MGASASSFPEDCVILVTGASRGIGKVCSPSVTLRYMSELTLFDQKCVEHLKQVNSCISCFHIRSGLDVMIISLSLKVRC